MPLIYRDTIYLEGPQIEHLEGVEEFLTGVGYVRRVEITPARDVEGVSFPRKAEIEFEFGAYTDEPDDLWTIHERAEEIHQDLRCRDILWTPDRACVRRKGSESRKAHLLVDLFQNNGRLIFRLTGFDAFLYRRYFDSRAATLRGMYWWIVRRYETELCQHCGRPVRLVYHAPDDLWELATGCARHPDGESAPGVLCPRCFDKIVEPKVTGYLNWTPEVVSR